MLTVKEAQGLINQFATNFGTEIISINEALDRVLAEDILADRDYPPFNRAAMDGFALRNEDFLNGIVEFKIIEEIYAGAVSEKLLASGECYKIMTGASTPLSADCIIRIEDTEQNDTIVVLKSSQLKNGQNISKKGEDKKEGELVISKNTILRPLEIAALAVLGKAFVSVYKTPIVSIISTGDEVISIDKQVLSHQIRDSNSYTIDSFLKKYKINLSTRVLVRDNKEKLTTAINLLIHSDILILSGGVSMGDADYVPEVLNSLNVEKIFHKVAIKPGKPLWFGKSNKGVVFALPGNPLSVQVVYKIFIEPFIRKCLGLSELPVLSFPINSDRKKKIKFDEYFPCKIEGELISGVTPIEFNGSGDVTSIISSQGIALHEAEKENLIIGESIKFYYW